MATTRTFTLPATPAPPAPRPGLDVVPCEAQDAVVLQARGRLTFDDVETLQQALELAWRQDASRIVLDLAACPYVDSSGVALLVKARERARRLHRAFVLAAPGPQVRSLLQLTRLHRVFSVFPTVSSALAATPSGFLSA